MRLRALRARGMSALERREMDDLARACVMVRWSHVNYVLEDRHFSWSGICQKCARFGWVQWSHIFGRKEWPGGIWIPENALALCSGCHYQWHNSPVRARETAIELIGGARLGELEAWRLAPNKHDQKAQRVANVAYLRDHAPHLLAQMFETFRERAEHEMKKTRRV